MDKIALILDKIKANNGYITTSEIEELKINRFYLSKLENEGKIERIKRGLYRSTESTIENELYEVNKIIPNGVLCLETAAEHYGLTTSIPYEYNVAIPRDFKVVLPVYPPIKLLFFSDINYKIGIVENTVNGNIIKMYDVEKTICDIARYRNKLGKNLYSEVIREYIKRKDKDINKLLEYGKMTKMFNVLKESLEVIL